MSLPSFEDMEARMESVSMSILGDTIQYRPAGGAWSAKKATVDYADQELDTGNGMAIAQAMTVIILKADLLEKPSGQCRVTLPKRPDEMFKPINVASDKSGNGWAFDLEKVFG